MSNGRRRRSLTRTAVELVVTLAIVLAATLFIRVYVVEARIVPTESMLPTVQPGDRVLVDRFLYRFVSPRRGDIIVFEPPPSAHPGTVAESDYLKRVVGLPGELVSLHGGTLLINDQPVKETYTTKLWNGDFDMHQPADGYFVLGDNRPNSFDSRYWGTVPREAIKGRAIAIYWPLRHLTSLAPTGEFAVDIFVLTLVLMLTMKVSNIADRPL